MNLILPQTVLNTSFGRLVLSFIRRTQRTVSNPSESRDSRPLKKIFKGKNGKKRAGVFAVILIASTAVFVVVQMISAASRPQPKISSDGRLEVEDAKAVQDIYQEFSFPLSGADGTEVSRIKYSVETVELRDQIVVKGQPATAVKGRTFLIVNLKVSNDFSSAIEMDTRDYIRLSVNGNKDEWLAPDIHNDPVEVQAISTKITRVGFPINEDDSDLILRVGEIGGEKIEVPLSF